MRADNNHPTRLVVLISGRGSNLAALQQALTDHPHLNAEITAVVSDQSTAPGLDKARDWGISTLVVTPKADETKSAFELRLLHQINKQRPDWIILAGFMRILSADFVAEFAGRMINIHPSLLPKYRGLNTHQRALDAQDPIHGASIHFVTATLDGGPVLSQVSLPVLQQDSAKTLAERLLPLEHRLLKATVALLLTEQVQCHDDAISINQTRVSKPLQLGHDLDDLDPQHALTGNGH